MSKKILYFILSLIAFQACKKDKDGVYPTIIFNSPFENAQFNVLESISVKASISDNESIESIRLTLIQSSTGRSVLEQKNYYPGSSNFQLEDSFYLSDSLLNSGEYYFRLDASDGENSTSAFVSFYIQGIAKRKLGFIAALDRGTSVSFTQVNNDFSQNQIFTSSACKEIAINSRYQQLWFVNPSTEKLLAVDMRTSQLKLDVLPNNNSQADQITDMQMADNKVYVSTKSGFVQAFSTNFSDIFTYSSPPSNYVENIYLLNNRLIVRESDLIGSNKKLLYLFNNGAVDSQTPTNDDIVGFGIRESNPETAFQFINKGNDLELRVFNLQTSQSSFFLSKPNLNFESLIRIREFEYLLIGDQEVASYNISTNFVRMIATNLSNPKVSYDDLNSEVYIASGSEVKIYNYAQASLVTSYSFAFPIIDLDLQYNK